MLRFKTTQSVKNVAELLENYSGIGPESMQAHVLSQSK